MRLNPVFHNNVVSINQNLENLTLLLDELDFQFTLIGVISVEKYLFFTRFLFRFSLAFNVIRIKL